MISDNTIDILNYIFIHSPLKIFLNDQDVSLSKPRLISLPPVPSINYKYNNLRSACRFLSRNSSFRIHIDAQSVGKYNSIYRLLILFIDMDFCRLHLNRVISGFLFCACFWLMPLFTRLRQRLKLLRFNSLRIKAITSLSEKPNCVFIASNGVRSSHAISMILSISLASIIIISRMNFFSI